MRHAAALVVLMIFAAAAYAGDDFKREVTITKIDGWFNTYSVPVADTKWTFDVAALTKKVEFGKIKFTHTDKDKDKNWYFPYEGAWRLVTDKTTPSQNSIPGSRVIRLVNETREHRTTLTLQMYFPKGKEEEVHCRGFFVFEEIEGPILGVFSFQ